MAKEYNYEMYGQPSLHTLKERKFNVYFSEPDSGINKDTGILLLIAGFGGNANSNVYKKMRNTFADKYNLVTIQCDYFGWEFMQGANNISLNVNKHQLQRDFKREEIDYIYRDKDIFPRLMEIVSNNKINLSAKENLKETLDNYNDMGLIQAIDNISAVISVIEVVKDNGHSFNENKIILYGHSHGAYLSYLCNAFAPSMFSLLIDNSSWLFPVYLKSNRYLNSMYGNSLLSVEFEYLAKTLEYDEEILFLPSLYEKLENQCEVICYHGTNDNLISYKDKVVLNEIIKKFRYNEIDNDKVDNKVFKSTQHGLGADFLELFDYTINNYDFEFKNTGNKQNANVTYKTRKNKYLVDYSSIVPVLHLERK
ncbi:hypothetical protein CIW83_04450 [Tissierella sp. P1]|uniref:DUF2920 family protein n=1 Tax=Tissierella TaxID=41273 RepID=UPI000BA153F9|nr:DUF2920 family protein [Tissierella sp. P1]OZV13450.1 hypothetical protein CIW83_04450 [Tissierella sp. P1]